MGADRLKDQKDQAKRGWNNAGRRLMQPTQLSLFDANPILGRRSFKVSLCSDTKAKIGEELLLQSANDNQFVTRGPEIVGQCSNLPASIVDELRLGGTLCLEVIEIGVIANTIEVAPK